MIKSIKDWFDSLSIEIIGVAIFLIITIPLIYLIILENRAWNEFKVTHDCKVIAITRGDLIVITNANGSPGFINSPTKTSYSCNDGVTYTR